MIMLNCLFAQCSLIVRVSYLYLTRSIAPLRNEVMQNLSISIDIVPRGLASTVHANPKCLSCFYKIKLRASKNYYSFTCSRYLAGKNGWKRQNRTTKTSCLNPLHLFLFFQFTSAICRDPRVHATTN